MFFVLMNHGFLLNQMIIPVYKNFRCDIEREDCIRIHVRDVLLSNVIHLSVPKQNNIEDILVTVKSLQFCQDC